MDYRPAKNSDLEAVRLLKNIQELLTTILNELIALRMRQ